MELKKDYEKLIKDLRENPIEILNGADTNYVNFFEDIKIDTDKNYGGIEIILIRNLVCYNTKSDMVFYDISTLPPKGNIYITKSMDEKHLEIIQEDYPIPDDIRKIIDDYGKFWMDELNQKYKKEEIKKEK